MTQNFSNKRGTSDHLVNIKAALFFLGSYNLRSRLMQAGVEPNDPAPFGFPRSETGSPNVADGCALGQLPALADLRRTEWWRDLASLAAAVSPGI